MGVSHLPKRFRVGLALILISRALAVYAQAPPPAVLRFDFTPIVGYRTNVVFTGPPPAEGAPEPRLSSSTAQATERLSERA